MKDYLEKDDLEYIARQRKRLGKKKFKSFVVNECETFMEGDLVNSVLLTSDSVSGYTDLTSAQLRQTWTKPVPPGSTLGTGRGKKKHSPGKVPGNQGSNGQ